MAHQHLAPVSRRRRTGVAAAAAAVLGDDYAARIELRPKRTPLPLRVMLFGEFDRRRLPLRTARHARAGTRESSTQRRWPGDVRGHRSGADERATRHPAGHGGELHARSTPMCW